VWRAALGEFDFTRASDLAWLGRPTRAPGPVGPHAVANGNANETTWDRRLTRDEAGHKPRCGAAKAILLDHQIQKSALEVRDAEAQVPHGTRQRARPPK
jgi:hypothetical protein